MAVSFKGAHFPKDIILMGVRWYGAYPLSYRHIEELMEERGVQVDHATINRWVIKYSPQLPVFSAKYPPLFVARKAGSCGAQQGVAWLCGSLDLWRRSAEGYGAGVSRGEDLGMTGWGKPGGSPMSMSDRR